MSLLIGLGGMLGLGGSSSSTSVGGSGTVGGSSIVGVLTGVTQNWTSNISAIIESGFNFSCWGSTHKPSDGKRYIATDLPKITDQTGIDKVFTERALELTIKYLKYYSETCLTMAGRFKKCSKQTLESCGNTANTALENLISSMGSSIEFVENRTESVVLPFTASIREEEFTKARLIQYPKYRIKGVDNTGLVTGTPTASIDYDLETGLPIVKSGVVSTNLLGTLALGGLAIGYLNAQGKGKKRK